MKAIIALLILIMPLAASGQIDLKNPPWNIGCDTLSTQLEMNVCSLDSYKLADSVLTTLYNKFIKHLDEVYKREAKLASVSEDRLEWGYLEALKNQREALIASHKEFIKFRDSLTEVVGYNYYRGSMRPMVENSYALELTVNQIKLLMDIMDDTLK